MESHEQTAGEEEGQRSSLEEQNLNLLPSDAPSGPAPAEPLWPLLVELYKVIQKQREREHPSHQHSQEFAQTEDEGVHVLEQGCKLLQHIIDVMQTYPHLLDALQVPTEDRLPPVTIDGEQVDGAADETAEGHPDAYQVLVSAVHYCIEMHRGDATSRHTAVEDVRQQRAEQHVVGLAEECEKLEQEHEEGQAQQALLPPPQERPPSHKLNQLKQLLVLVTSACICLGEVTFAVPLNCWQGRRVVDCLLRLLAPEERKAIQEKQKQALQLLGYDEEAQQQQLRLLEQQLLMLQIHAAQALGNIAIMWPIPPSFLYRDSNVHGVTGHLLKEVTRQFLAVHSSNQSQQQQTQQDQVDKERLAAARQLGTAARLRSALERYFTDSNLPGTPDLRRSPKTAEDAHELAGWIADAVAVLRVEVRQQQALLLEGFGSDRRKCVVEILWCLAAYLGSMRLYPKALDQVPHSSAAAVVAAASPDLTGTLLHIVELTLKGSARARETPPDQEQIRRAQEDPEVFVRATVTLSGVDALLPSLRCLSEQLVAFLVCWWYISVQLRGNRMHSCWLLVVHVVRSDGLQKLYR